MKCRGCGNDTNDVDIRGLGWMHWGCEVERLQSLLDEASLYEALRPTAAAVEAARSVLKYGSEATIGIPGRKYVRNCEAAPIIAREILRLAGEGE